MREPRPLPDELLALARTQRSALAGAQVRDLLGERGLRGAVTAGQLVKLWQGAYALPLPTAAPPTAALPTAPLPTAALPTAALPTPALPTAVLPTPALSTAAQPAPHPVLLSSTGHTVPVVTRLAAAELTLGRPVTACLHSAAELYGFAIDPDAQTHVIGVAPSARPELVIHRTPQLSPTNRTRGFDVVGVAETAVRLAARAANPPRGLAVLDAALRTNYTSTALLREIAERMRVNGVGRVRSLIAIADPRAESPPESWLRWVCHDAGFPAAVPQYWVRCPNGRWYRLDLAWPSIKFGLEYDGVGVHTGAALTSDRKRLGALNRAGWTVQSVTAPMLWAGRAELVADLRADLQQRGAL